MIQQGWQPIGEPSVPELSPDAKAVQDFITENSIAQITRKTESAMCRALHIGINRLQDAVYEFRKWEAINMGKLSNQQRAAIYQAWKDGTTQKELAKQYGVSVQTISQLCTKLAKAEQEIMQPVAEDKPMPERAVPIAQVTKPVVMTEERTAAPPDVVRKAVLYRIADIDDECNAAEAKINALREKIHELTKERGELEIWMEEVKRDESTEN